MQSGQSDGVAPDSRNSTMSLFVDEDDTTYDGNDVTHVAIEDQEELPPAEISAERTNAHYQQALNPQRISPPPDQSNNEQPEIPVVFSEKQDTSAVYESREICCNLPLSFYQEILENMLSKDGMLILGHGLGCEMVTANMLYALSAPSISLEVGNITRKKRSLVILLNARDEELVKLQDEVMELTWMNTATDPNSDETDLTPPIRVIGGSEMANTTKRRAIYEKGGILSVSSQVLVVDLLSGIIAPNDITGIIVSHGEKVRETSNELFIVNLYRDGNEWGFVKAISDEPEMFTGFTPLATKLKILRLTNVILWPRFHVEVSSSLIKASGNQRTTVTEINVALSKKMAKIQSAILTCLQACLQELRRHNPTLDSEYWDMENVHDSEFVSRVRFSLDLQWHRISWTSKQLVYDLATLKDLLMSLLTDDSLTYYQKVQGIVDSNMKLSGAGTMNMSTMSPWLMMDEATTIMSFSKERALGKVTVGTTQINTETNEEIVTSSEEVYNLEELPKWDQLALIIDDIMHERSVSSQKSDGPVLVMCSNGKTAQQLASVLVRCRKRENAVTGKKLYSSRGYMVSKLGEYLLWKQLTSLTKRLNAELSAPDENAEGSASPQPEDERLNTSKTFTRGNNTPKSKRRRTRGASAVANVARLYSGSNFEKTAGAVDLDDDIVQRIEQQLKEEEDSDSVQEISSGEEEDLRDGNEDELFVKQDDNDGVDLLHIEKFNQIVIETYDKNTNESLLQELAPAYIILYEPNLSFIRRVEVYQALNPTNPAKTYFMYYGTSVEEQIHLTQIKKEKQAFTKLIKEKATLGKHFAGDAENWKFHLRKPQVANTRIAGGANFRTEADEMRVIVDTREFRSSLPNLLYRVGIKVIPCMITVGDYILLPKICVERKAIPDLIASFKSGRLYQQCEQMFRHYETPALLIEFDESKSFSFEPFSELRPPGQKTNAGNPISGKILKKEIQLKLTELLISFPKLKIIWSSSPYETAQIFLELKASQTEPDIEEALSKGVNPQISTNEGPPVFNDDALDLLQSIPGINNVNYTIIIQKVKNLAQLVCLPREVFVDLLGEENGNKAYNFINHEVSH